MKDSDREAIIAALTGEASAAELRRLIEWRAASDDHEEEYQRLCRLWSTAGEFVPGPGIGAAASPQAVIDAARRREGTRTAAIGSGARSRVLGAVRRFLSPPEWGMGWSAVGAGMVAVGVALGFWLSQEQSGAPYGAESFVTGVDEVATVMLQDETIVRLAPSSRLTILDLRQAREVALVGRAFFAVTREPDRPFRVRLPTGDVVEVLGTRFDVMTREEEVQVAVTEGQVRVGTLGARVEIEANEIARIRDGEIPRVERVANPYEVIDWLGPFLAFETTPLSDVATELQQRFGTRIEIVNAELGDRTVTGWFADQSPEEIVGGICRVVGATCTVEGGVHRMSLGPMP